jgi:hypothetical protein
MFFARLKTRLPSIRNFAREYLMVVIGVLTALGLEQWVVHVHQNRDAASASAQIEAELRTNLANIRHARTVDLDHLAKLEAIRAGVVRDFKARLPDAEIARRIVARAQDFGLDMRWPILHHEAWDVAVADQSASWIDSRKVRRYASAYASMRDTNVLKQQDENLIMADSHMFDVMTDIEIGDVQPRRFLYTIGDMSDLLRETSIMLGALDDELGKALPDGGHGAENVAARSPAKR